MGKVKRKIDVMRARGISLAKNLKVSSKNSGAKKTGSKKSVKRGKAGKPGKKRGKLFGGKK